MNIEQQKKVILDNLNLYNKRKLKSIYNDNEITSQYNNISKLQHTYMQKKVNTMLTKMTEDIARNYEEFYKYMCEAEDKKFEYNNLELALVYQFVGQGLDIHEEANRKEQIVTYIMASENIQENINKYESLKSDHTKIIKMLLFKSFIL